MVKNHKNLKPNTQVKESGDKIITTNDQNLQDNYNIKMVWVPVDEKGIEEVKELDAKVFCKKD